MSKNILICGIGGQGTVLAAKILSQAALSKGENVLSAETIGMAQRGGSVVSHVRIGSDVYSPLISKGQADIIIAFEASEAVRNLEYLKEGGTVIVNNFVSQPSTASLSGKVFEASKMIEYLKSKTQNVIAVDALKIAAQIGSAKIVNMVLLGAAGNSGILSLKDLKDAVKILVKPAFYDMNVKALEYKG